MPVKRKPAKVLYAEPSVKVCIGKEAITVETAKLLLGWETEDDYAARLMAENEKHTNPDSKYHAIRRENIRFDLDGEDGNVLEYMPFDCGDDRPFRVKCYNVQGVPSEKKLLKVRLNSAQSLKYLIRENGNISGRVIVVGKTGKVRLGAKTLITFIENAREGDVLEAIILFGYTD